MKPVAHIFLDSQNRHRDYGEYRNILSFDHECVNSADKSILTIGGGVGVYEFPYKMQANITNVDLQTHHDPARPKEYQITSIQNDFTKTNLSPNSFDEIWALYSLPLYCTSIAAVRLFLLKSLYYLQAGGTLRIHPILPMTDDGYKKLMKKYISSMDIFNTFYNYMNELCEFGIADAACFWPEIYRSDVFADSQLAELHPGQYQFIKHDFTRQKVYPHAIISKPNSADNQDIKERISKVKKRNRLSQAKVYFNNRTKVL